MFILMLILSSILMLILSMQKKKGNGLLWLANLLLLVMIFCLSLYIAKKGGINTQLQRLLFVDRSIRSWLQYYYFNLNTAGYLIAITKIFFPLTIYFYQVQQNQNRLIMTPFRAMLLLIAVGFLIVYIPSIYKTYIYHDFEIQRTLMNITNFFCVSILVLTVIEYFKLLRSLIADFLKNEMIIYGLFTLYLTVIYLVFFSIDPGALYNFYTFNPALQGSIYISFLFPNEFYYFTFAAIVLCFLTFLFFILRYFRTYLIYHRKLRHSREIDSILNPIISSIFHNFKNEILTYRVLTKRMRQAMDGEEENLDVLEKNISLLEEKNDEVYKKLEVLYESMKFNDYQKHPLSVEELLTDIVKDYPSVQPKLVVNEDSYIHANRHNLTEALKSIIDNAIEATQLVISEGEPRVWIEVKRYMDYCLVTIRDNGKGILPEKIEEIFKPFYSDKNSKTNWGMGLYNARRVILYYGGEVEVKSEIDEGTLFLVFLPISKGE